MHTYAVTAFLTLLPISELRGGIPYALGSGLTPIFTYFYCVFINMLVGPLVFVFLSTLHKIFDRWHVYHGLFLRVVERSRKRLEQKVRKFGYLGVALFVAIPLPITGAYTGTLGAWILGLEAKKTYLSVAAGVCIAGIIVTLVSFFGIKALSFFLK